MRRFALDTSGMTALATQFRVHVPGKPVEIDVWAAWVLCWIYREVYRGNARYDGYQEPPDTIDVRVFPYEIGDMLVMRVSDVVDAIYRLEDAHVLAVVDSDGRTVLVRLVALAQALAAEQRRFDRLQRGAVSILETADPRKQFSGTVSMRMARLIARFDGRCAYCGRWGTYRRDPDDKAWSRDHIRPQIMGGTNQPDNLVLACRMCNTVKLDRPVAYLMQRLAERGLPDPLDDAGPGGRARAAPPPDYDDEDIPF